MSLTPLQQFGRAEAALTTVPQAAAVVKDGLHRDLTRTQHGGSRVLDQGLPWDTVVTNEIGNDHGQTKSLMGNVSSTHEVVYFHDFIILEGHYLDSVRSRDHWVNMKTQWNAGTNRTRVDGMRVQTTQELKPEDTVTNILTGSTINHANLSQYVIYENPCAPKVSKSKNSYALIGLR